MVIFVDGFQSCGKSTLIENSGWKHARFPFDKYLNELEIKDLAGYQLGKDLGIMFGLSGHKGDLVLDRGPFSTVFYSLKENRYGRDTGKKMMAFIREISEFEGFRYIFVVKKNDDGSSVRKREDGFDYLDDEHDRDKEKLLKEIQSAAASFGVKLEIFENDFSKTRMQNAARFQELLERIKHEHD